ncbi:hypothetical protein K8P10_002769 [Leucobacter sp. Psy1]|uniref:hypothetical protein n=1 Tax=Leucobacter sp. Psy1 TaxID=2875729 RepID=UPI001CD1B9D0|nr:hypothetical protein [Leucobacter sp. Psy1]UBH07258.1 hypothetical protein K8P10_002769 [Leucobacter sp. Psy1]
MSTSLRISPAVRWILALDYDCGPCSDFGRRLRAEVGEELEIRGLKDPDIVHWRQVTGDTRDWTPVLLRIEGDRAESWTRLGLATKLIRRFGLRTSRRILSIVGESRKAIGVSSPERRMLFRIIPSILLGGAVAGATLGAARSREAEFDAEWILGAEANLVCDDARRDPGVTQLTRELFERGFAAVPDQDAAIEKEGRTTALLSFRNEDEKRFSILRYLAENPARTRAELIDMSGDRPIVIEELFADDVAPLFKWNRWADCVAFFCPACAAFCGVTGVIYPGCLVTCCAGGLATCASLN